MEFISLIEKYADPSYSSHSRSVSESEWGDLDKARRYCDRYWLNDDEYQQYWRPYHKAIFTQESVYPPAMVFTPPYRLILHLGGCLFDRVEFEKLSECMKRTSTRQFAIVENPVTAEEGFSPIRLRFPADISWDTLMSGQFFSALVIEMLYKEYFVFPDSDAWGKYAATEYSRPVDILGVRQEYANVFCRVMPPIPDIEREMLAHLPEEYHARLCCTAKK